MIRARVVRRFSAAETVNSLPHSRLQADDARSRFHYGRN
jgi:hypothetical protein